MGLINHIKSLIPKVKVIISCAAALLIAAVCTAAFAGRNYLAETERLLRFEGTVILEDCRGGSKSDTDYIVLQTCNVLNTSADGIASADHDETELVTLQNDSRAEFQKIGKRLELKLTGGVVSENTFEAFAPLYLANNDALPNRVAAYSGWNKDTLKHAIKDLETENIQGPSETPTPVSVEEKTEDESAPMPTPATSLNITPIL